MACRILFTRFGQPQIEGERSSWQGWEAASRFGSAPDSLSPAARTAIVSHGVRQTRWLRREAQALVYFLDPVIVQSRHSPCRGIGSSHGEGGGVNRERAS